MAWFLKPTFVALALVVVGVLTVGWGAYSVVARPSSESDEAELADLEGFDLESPSLGQSQPTDDAPAPRLGDSLSRQQSSLPITERAPQLPSPPPAGSFELPPQSSLPSFQSARYERDPAGRDAGLETNSGAWLSGAIEASEDVPSRILLPSRISQAVVDGPAIR